MDDLKPCPFCGGDAEQDFQQPYRAMQSGRIDHGAAVYCTKCNANMILCRGDHPERTDEERMAVVVDNWSTRADDAEITRLRGEVERLTDHIAEYESHVLPYWEARATAAERRLKEAVRVLMPFAEASKFIEQQNFQDRFVMIEDEAFGVAVEIDVDADHFRAARAFLEKEKTDGQSQDDQ